jgi:hypothetical protein
MTIEYELKYLKEYYDALKNELDEALQEAEIMRELLFELRSICFSEYAVNDQILKQIAVTVKKELKYTHKDWLEDYSCTEDEDGNPIKFYIANKYRAKTMKKDASRSRKGKNKNDQ